MIVPQTHRVLPIFQCHLAACLSVALILASFEVSAAQAGRSRSKEKRTSSSSRAQSRASQRTSSEQPNQMMAGGAPVPAVRVATPPNSLPPASVALASAPVPTPSPISTEVAEKTLYTFRATDLELKAALAMFARANQLNIVPDPGVTGQVTVELHDLPLERVMQALLEAHDYTWFEEDGLIRVRAVETREYWIDYLRLSRKGTGISSATLASGMGTSGGGSGAGSATEGSSVNLTADNAIDFWVELKEELGRLLTPAGRESMAINMTAGIIQITDRPSALKRVGRYLDSLTGSVSRQVEIRARIFDVTLRDQFQFGIDWARAVEAFGGVASVGGSTLVTAPVGGFPIRDNAFQFFFENSETSVLLEALEEQGEVNVVSQPRIRVVNNQTAMIKVGTETPFFSSRTTFIPGAATGTTTQLQEDTVNTITIGTILSITPQISSNEWVTLDIAPVLTSLVETRVSPSETTTAPVLDIKQASTLVRFRSGTTIVLGGLMQDEHARTTRKVPVLGDIPLLGHLFRGKVDVTAKKELVISITPTIVEE